MTEILRYVIQRLIALVFTFMVILAVVFFVVRSTPGSVFQPDPNISPTAMELIIERYHLDRTVPEQFMFFMRDYLSFDFGRSLVLRPAVPVMDILAERLPITMQLNFISNFIILPFGLIFGISMALKKDSVYDHAASTMVMFLISVPSFVMAAFLQYFLAFRLGWFPIMLAPETTFNWTLFYSMILPILALSFGSIVGIARMMRAELAETMNSEFLLLAKAKGLTYRQMIWRHALRNASVPLASTFLSQVIFIMSGSIVIEMIFGVPGMARAMIDAMQVNDHPVVLAIIYFYVVIGLFMAILMDLSFGVLDPRIRMGARQSEQP